MGMDLLQTIDSSRQIVLWTGYFLIGAAVYCLTWSSVREQESREAEAQLEDSKGRQSVNALINITKPVFRYYFLPMVRGKKYWAKKSEFYRTKLVTAGLRSDITSDEFIAFKMVLILFFPIALGLMKVGQLIDLSWPVIFLSGIAGWFYPDLWIRGLIAKRQREILRSLPFTVDLLAVSVDAGLDFLGAIGKVVEKSKPNALVEELEQVLREIKVGTSRTDALRDMAKRVGMTEMNSFIAILISSEKMGSPIGRVLRQQSEQIRMERFVRAEKLGAIAAQKLMLPIIFLVVPAVMLMIFGPFILSIVGGGGSI